MIRTAAAFFFVGLVTLPQARAAGLPVPLVVPGLGTAVGCTLKATKSNAGVTLEIAPGIPYARVAQIGAMEVTLPIGRDAPAAGVSIVAGNLKLRGVATPSSLALYPARPFVVGEVFVPGPHSRLRWSEVTANRVAVEVELAKESKTEFRDVRGPLRASRPCADLRLTSLASFDSYDALGGRGYDLAAGLRSSSAPVPIAAQPNGPALAKLVVNRKAARNEVTVIDENDAGWSRIARPATGDLLVVGWVKQRQLGKPPARDTTFAAFGSGGLKPPSASGGAADAAASYACPKEIPIVAEVGTLRRTVGAIGPGVHLRTAATAEADLVSVQFPDGAAAAVTPLKGARLLVRRADVSVCPGFSAP